MGFELSYMGTKRQLAPAVAEVVCSARTGTVLDLFSGMCAVGDAIGSRRQIWSNDIQVFAARVAEALFASKDVLPPVSYIANALFNDFRSNFQRLESRIGDQMEKEAQVVESGTYPGLISYLNQFSNWHVSPRAKEERARLARKPRTFPYRLFTMTYACTYFSLQQCAEIDSIVYAIDRSLQRRSVSQDQGVWLLIVLGQSMIRVANTTGHFAQYLEPKPHTLRRYVNQLKRSVWEEYLASLGEACPVGTAAWRKHNRVFNCEGIHLLSLLTCTDERPSVVYADPPYTDDQYSRYYHVLETLVKYDYPKVSSKGRYRNDRFQTPFSQKTRALLAFSELVRNAAALGADLVISYPDNGLLHKIGETPQGLLGRHFNKVEVTHRIAHNHSTLGASKGPAQTPVTEVVYWGKL